MHVYFCFILEIKSYYVYLSEDDCDVKNTTLNITIVCIKNLGTNRLCRLLNNNIKVKQKRNIYLP